MKLLAFLLAGLTAALLSSHFASGAPSLLWALSPVWLLALVFLCIVVAAFLAAVTKHNKKRKTL